MSGNNDFSNFFDKPAPHNDGGQGIGNLLAPREVPAVPADTELTEAERAKARALIAAARANAHRK